MVNIRNNPITSPARSTLQGIANKDVPIIVFHIAKLKTKSFLNIFLLLILIIYDNVYTSYFKGFIF